MTYLPFDPATFRWEGVTDRAYKDDPGTARGMAWRGISRNTLARVLRGALLRGRARRVLLAGEARARARGYLRARDRAGAGRRRGARAAAVRPRPQRPMGAAPV